MQDIIADTEWNFYIEAMEAPAQQDKKEKNEHMQEVTQQNALMTLVQAQQQKIKELVTQSKNLIYAMTIEKTTTGAS